MKAFQFRLERVLAVKERREELAEMHQRQARARLEEARAECARIEDHLSHVTTSAAANLREAALLGIWQIPYEHAAALETRLAAAQQQLREAEKQLQEADRLRIQASLEAEALRTLRAREREQHRRETARRQQDDLDELGLQRWLAQDRGPFASPGNPAKGEPS
jgi:flagellar export protein FliJ